MDKKVATWVMIEKPNTSIQLRSVGFYCSYLEGCERPLKSERVSVTPTVVVESRARDQ